MENVKELWKEIKQRFSIGNGPHVQQLKSDLVNCKRKGKSLWDESNNYDSIPVCTCTGCKCNITTQLEKKQEEERVHQFLMGLDENGYGIVRSNILSTEPLPNLNQVYAMIVQQERGDGKDKIVICSNCKRKGHEADSCFQRIGYPEWWGDGPRTTTGGRSGGRGRGVRGCRWRTRMLRKISRLNDEQWATLLTMLNSHKGGANEKLTDGDWAGEQREGLYFLKERMGHPSSRVVDLIYEIDSVGRNDSVKNKTPSVLLDGRTPYEILYGQGLSYKHIRTFGCLCYAHDQNRDKDKFSSRSRKCIFVGYPFGKKGWRRILYFNNVVNSSLTENRVVDYFADDEDPYVQNDMEEQQASISDVEHEIDGTLTCQDLRCPRNSLARENG
ncbi:hypothetical protein AAG906_016392 [Vitis piasezkii]